MVIPCPAFVGHDAIVFCFVDYDWGCRARSCWGLRGHRAQKVVPVELLAYRWSVESSRVWSRHCRYTFLVRKKEQASCSAVGHVGGSSFVSGQNERNAESGRVQSLHRSIQRTGKEDMQHFTADGRR